MDRAGRSLPRWVARVVAIILAAAVAGCATTSSTPKVVTDIKQLVGSWTGWIAASDGGRYPFPATLSIHEDGTFAITTSRSPIYYGRVGIVDGAARWAAADPKLPWFGTATLVDENGREWLTFRRPNGQVWTEVDRGK
jgi:hypothetical protein